MKNSQEQMAFIGLPVLSWQKWGGAEKLIPLLRPLKPIQWVGYRF